MSMQQTRGSSKPVSNLEHTTSSAAPGARKAVSTSASLLSVRSLTTPPLTAPSDAPSGARVVGASVPEKATSSRSGGCADGCAARRRWNARWNAAQC